MCITMSAQPTARIEAKPARTRPARTPARLILVIAGRAYRLWALSFDPSLQSEMRHVLQDSRGRFSVYEQDIAYDDAVALLHSGDRFAARPSRFHCDRFESSDCDHVNAMVDLGLL